MLWQGKELKEYSKEELMLIIENILRAMKRQGDRHVAEIKELMSQKEV